MDDRDTDNKPPPLPDRLEASDEAKTIPASTAWEVVSESSQPEQQKEDPSLALMLEGRMSTALYRYDDAGSPVDELYGLMSEEGRGPRVDQVPKPEVEARPVRYEKAPPRQYRPEQHDEILSSERPPATWSRTKTAVVAIVSVMSLAAYVVLNRPADRKTRTATPAAPTLTPTANPGVPQPVSTTPVQPVPVLVPDTTVSSAPPPPEPDRVPEQYRAARKRIETIIAAIGGDSQTAEAGRHQNLRELWKQVRAATLSGGANPVATLLGERMTDDFKVHSAGAPVPWDRLWKLGITVYHAASAEIDSARKDFGHRSDLGVKADIAGYRRWLIKWLLGERGVYCQARQRFWEQVKNGDPPIPKEERPRIGELRRERRRHLDRWKMRHEKLYDFCERDIL